MLYLLDANVLITAWNTYYEIERVPEFWGWLVHMGESNNVKIPLEMYEEIIDGKDELAVWAKRYEVESTLVLDEAVDIHKVRLVTNTAYASDLTDEELEKVGRDPFLVAYALVNKSNRVVVTTEVSKPKKTRANRHVPDVCSDFGIRCIDTFALSTELDFRTDWDK